MSNREESNIQKTWDVGKDLLRLSSLAHHARIGRSLLRQIVSGGSGAKYQWHNAGAAVSHCPRRACWGTDWNGSCLLHKQRLRLQLSIIAIEASQGPSLLASIRAPTL